MERRICSHCKIELKERHKIKYCSNACQREQEYLSFIGSWKKGMASGGIGIHVRALSGYVKRYLFKKFGERCSICAWDERHPLTGRVPLEIDHIDGDSENNSEENLQLICPNCHSLSLHYKNLNKGRGRKWRMAKYIKN